jgi:hypothetical protein
VGFHLGCNEVSHAFDCSARQTSRSTKRFSP